MVSTDLGHWTFIYILHSFQNSYLKLWFHSNWYVIMILVITLPCHCTFWISYKASKYLFGNINKQSKKYTYNQICHLKGIQIQNHLWWNILTQNENKNRNGWKNQNCNWIQVKFGLGPPWCIKAFVISDQQVTFSLSLYDYLSIRAKEIRSLNQSFLFKVKNTCRVLELNFNRFPFLFQADCFSWGGGALAPYPSP